MSVKKWKTGEIRNGFPVLPRQERKTILLLGDWIGMFTGVGCQSRIIVNNTCHYFNWINLGLRFGNPYQVTPETWNIQDVSQTAVNITGVQDAYVRQLVSHCYGEPWMIEKILNQQKIDAIMIFTDPHQWYWLFNIERYIRQRVPLIYYNIWDNIPYPQYNQQYYSCCDLIMNISKQTNNIVKTVCLNYKREQWQTKYVPHGIQTNCFYPIGKDNKQFYNFCIERDYQNTQFVVFYNSRNINRKQLVRIIQSWKFFMKQLSPQKRSKCRLFLRTQLVDLAGMPIVTCINDLFTEQGLILNIIAIPNNISDKQLNFYYNMADITVSMAECQGFGLSTCESLHAGTPILAPVIGGLQDQMRFTDQTGKIMQFNEFFPTNMYKKYQQHGEWAFPVFIATVRYQGSMPTPYIYETDVNSLDWINELKYAYSLGRKELKKRGKSGHDWVTSNEARMTAQCMGQSMMQYITDAINNFKPRNRYTFFKSQPKLKPQCRGIYNQLTKQWE